MATPRETFNDRPVYSLFEISKSIESVISKTYTKAYYIKAEILKLNYYPHSGHCYPELVEKENGKIKSQIRGVIWSAQFKTINERFKTITGEAIKEDITVLCLATITYSGRHGFALHIQDIEPVFTLGEILRNRKLVIEKLKKEKVFHLNKSLPLPLVVQRIAIISVETSKGYSDFMVTLQREGGYPFITTLFPSVLQGDHAIGSIMNQLLEIEKRHQEFDSVIIIRGGGGDVGMTCYDDYQLAHKVATFPLPVITGIGHSTNETVTDMVAYSNKITPTEVAYFFIQKWQEYENELEKMGNIIANFSLQWLKNKQLQCENIEKSISISTQKITHQKKIEWQMAVQQFQGSWQKFLDSRQQILEMLQLKIELLKPENVLKRGYSITLHQGKPLLHPNEVKAGDVVTTKLYHGEIETVVIGEK